jgi:hypothetical protein
VKSRLAIAINKAQQINPGKYGAPRMATALYRVEEYLKSLEEHTQTGTETGSPEIAAAQP